MDVRVKDAMFTLFLALLFMAMLYGAWQLWGVFIRYHCGA